MVSNLYFSYSLNTLLLTVSCKHELTIPQLSEYTDCSTVGKYLTSPFYFPALTSWNPVRTAQKIQKSQTLKSQKVIKTKMFLFYVPGEIVRVKSVFNGTKSSVCRRHFGQRRSKRTEGDLIYCWLLSLALFFFFLSLTSSSLSLFLRPFFFFLHVPLSSLHLPLLFNLFFYCLFPLSLLSALSPLFFFQPPSLSPIPSFFPPSSFSFFSLSLYVPSPVTIVDILPSSSVRLIYNNAIKIKKVNQMIFLF